MNAPSSRPPAAIARRWRTAAAIALVVTAATIARAQDVTEPSLKAAFVYNFAKFTEWPEDVLPATGSFSACVLDQGPFGDALERAVKGRQVSGRQIVVQRVRLGGALRACHLLFVSGLDDAQVGAVVAAVRGAAVLTISDIDDFARIGGIAHVFVENGKMRFDLNLELARRSRLQLSSKLLSLAARVHDGSGTGQK
jgi:YfiR/HmsC-like